MQKQMLKGAAIFGGAVASAAIFGGLFNPGRSDTKEWYSGLEKPPFNPPDAIFGPVWTVLYAMIAVSGYRVWSSPDSSERSRALALWSTQLLLNGVWSPIFFGAKKPAIALADIALLLPSIAAYAAASGKVDRAAGWMMAPYLVWVSFATVLNAEIVRRNRD